MEAVVLLGHSMDPSSANRARPGGPDVVVGCPGNEALALLRAHTIGTPGDGTMSCALGRTTVPDPKTTPSLSIVPGWVEPLVLVELVVLK